MEKICCLRLIHNNAAEYILVFNVVCQGSKDTKTNKFCLFLDSFSAVVTFLVKIHFTLKMLVYFKDVQVFDFGTPNFCL